MYVTGEYREAGLVADALRALGAAGIGAGDLDLFSEEPVALPRGVLDRPSRMSLASVLCAIAFGLTATGFIYFCQHNYKLVTGGMPLFSMWATGVITYEMIMLGAIVAAFGWFLWESGLIHRREDPAVVPALEPGSIYVRVRCPGEQAAAVLDVLRGAGATGLARKGEA